MTYPAAYRYTKQHEWIEAKGEVGTVGITDYAQCQIGEVVFVELPKPGAKFASGATLATVESVKAVFEIYAPASGEVLEVNAALQNAPEKVNSDPHGAAWFVKLRLQNPRQIDELMDAPAYEAFVSEQEAHA
ncbi:MAG TPA: glycine cleavage system protein GcvH [Candidatus Acidoferrales bacterium]|nr:glycine cleavage system protein GcvH [Candidatus Acidoferrales bacterium]